MASNFGATSTMDEVLSGIDLKGRRVLITGVSAGFGVESARALAADGAQVSVPRATSPRLSRRQLRSARRLWPLVAPSSWCSSIWPTFRTCAPAPIACCPMDARLSDDARVGHCARCRAGQYAP